MSSKAGGIPQSLARGARAASKIRSFFLDAGIRVYLPLLCTSGLARSTAFGLFVVHYGRMLLSR